MTSSTQQPGSGVGTGFATKRNSGGNDNISGTGSRASQAGAFAKDPLNYLGGAASAPFNDAAKGFADGYASGGAGAAGAAGGMAGMW
jgi:hypothetical protein